MIDPRRIKVIAGSGYRLIYDDRAVSLRYHPDGARAEREGAGDPSPSDAVPAATAHGPCEAGPPEAVRHGLRKVSLVVSTQCTMACRYCYANGGRYETPGLLMDGPTALGAINRLRGAFGDIEHVNFFGGEPTLNAPLIRMVTGYLQYLCGQGVLRAMPRLGITTNGFEIGEQTLDFLALHEFGVCVSLDGPSEVHDRTRISKSGAGTYAGVRKTIRKLLERGIVPEFECTYTAEHIRLGISVTDLMDFFASEFSCRTLHCPPVMARPGSPLFVDIREAAPLYADAIRHSIANLASGVSSSLSVASRLLASLREQRPQQDYCPAGRSSLTVHVDGTIHPCFMLMDGGDLSLGRLADSDKWRSRTCEDCWARSLCFGCVGEDHLCGTSRSAVPGESPWCDFRRTLREAFLGEFGEQLHRTSAGPAGAANGGGHIEE
jgi:uncharacterized protein